MTLKEIDRYLGPYVRGTDNRRFMVVFYKDGSRSTTLYSRYLMQEHLGRWLDPDLETVDHINGDVTDDRIENLQLLDRAEHAKKDKRPKPMYEFWCPVCDELSEIPLSQYRANQLVQGKDGPYCSRSCAAKIHH